ncbi:MAG TPA: maleylpyruvate isomerase family mycothiol-dependent enzyme [Acidimicrobiia bacterium]|nr:maleylpyruvate isomerase family mycothiol-dependent enzyme [Acidimicrobiia bacterium]
MNTTEYLDAIARESAALADAAERAGLDASVPACPGWTVFDLVEHVGNVQRWAALTVTTLPTERISRSEMRELPPPAELVAWFRAASATLVDALAAADPSAPVWTFSGEHSVRFWFRRQAHEVAVHRWDAALAAGAPTPIDTSLAIDGIAEWLEMSLGRLASGLVGHGETVHLHCTDTSAGTATDAGSEAGGEWLVTLAADGPTVEARHAKGDVAARGTASDLDLFVWGRLPADGLDVFGDAELLERFRRAGFA